MNTTFHYYNLVHQFKKLTKYSKHNLKVTKMSSTSTTPSSSDENINYISLEEPLSASATASPSPSSLPISSPYHSAVDELAIRQQQPQIYHRRSNNATSSHVRHLKAPKEHIRVTNGYERFD